MGHPIAQIMTGEFGKPETERMPGDFRKMLRQRLIPGRGDRSGERQRDHVERNPEK